MQSCSLGRSPYRGVCLRFDSLMRLISALSDTKSNLYRFCTDHDQVSDIYATVSLADQVPDYL